MRLLKLFAFGLCFVSSLFALTYSSLSAPNWKVFNSETGLYNVMLPKNPDEKITELRISNDLVMHSVQTESYIDQRPYRNAVQSYIIKLEQTFGPAISPEEKTKLIKREMRLYEETYKEYDGFVLDKSFGGSRQELIGKITIQYVDRELGEHIFFAKIILNDTTKVDQVFTGTQRDFESLDTKSYLNSFDMISGIVNKPGDLNDDWIRVESPFSLFSIKVPPIAFPYIQSKPSLSKSENREQVGVVFSDPIWLQNLFYNVRGYRFDQEVTFQQAEEVIINDYLAKHGRSMIGISLQKDFINDIPYIQTEHQIRPPEKYKYLNTARVRALFLGNYLIIQELTGPRHLIKSDFSDNIFKMIEFTPQKARKKEVAERMGLQLAPDEDNSSPNPGQAVPVLPTQQSSHNETEQPQQ